MPGAPRPLHPPKVPITNVRLEPTASSTPQASFTLLEGRAALDAIGESDAPFVKEDHARMVGQRFEKRGEPGGDSGIRWSLREAGEDLECSWLPAGTIRRTALCLPVALALFRLSSSGTEDSVRR